MRFEKEKLSTFENIPLENYANECCLYPIGFQNHIAFDTLATNLQAEDEILLNTFNPNIRNEIRKCEREYKPQVIINENPTKEDIEEHLQYYKFWLESKGLNLYENIDFYRHRLNLYRKNNCLAIVVAKSLLINSHIQDTYFVDRENKIVRLTTSISTFRNEDSLAKKINGALNKFAKFETLKHFKSKAFRLYDWGGRRRFLQPIPKSAASMISKNNFQKFGLDITT